MVTAVVDNRVLFDVLHALYQVSHGDVHDSVAQDQLRLELNGTASDLESAVARLVEIGLAKTSAVEGDVRVSITDAGIHSVTGPTGGSR
jgi:DNA-binding MarR family transcriptional regulator